MQKFVTLCIEYNDNYDDPDTWDWATLLDVEYKGYVNNGDGTGYHQIVNNSWEDWEK